MGWVVKRDGAALEVLALYPEPKAAEPRSDLQGCLVRQIIANHDRAAIAKIWKLH